ncbi:hypothetical protein Y032_0067g18 [Ancylostoma ceylanicum]|uniref:Uncharacterized protein n=1 Tax=Ancylostoma ceylanicum TaxID=53326 RepID=A0A016TZA3_9BILA|nr:hypothetical protein Y032_0067g18 [Ancylostoma ceylanicum]
MPTSCSVSGVSTLEDLSQSSLRRLRNMSERAVRKVKTFVSRPIKETTMKRFVNKVEARKQAEMTGQIMVRTVKRGDDVFPKQRLRKSQERCKSKENSFKMDTSIKSVYSAAPSSKYGDLPSGNRLVYGNKNNNGKLMVNDEPFWTLQRKPTEADLDESGTDDDLQLNADTALEVYEGKTKLENMPSIPIILDPMNELSELKRRDNLFYTKGVLFGNSVRSMINLCDTSFKATPIVRRRGRAEITFQEPEVMYSYLRERASETRKVPFKPGLAASSRRSRKARKRRSAPKCEGGTDDGGGGTGSSSTPSDNKSGKSSKKGNRLRDRLVQSALDSRGSGGGVKENDENQKIKPEQQLEPRSPIQAPVPIN